MSTFYQKYKINHPDMSQQSQRLMQFTITLIHTVYRKYALIGITILRFIFLNEQVSFYNMDCD